MNNAIVLAYSQVDMLRVLLEEGGNLYAANQVSCNLVLFYLFIKYVMLIIVWEDSILLVHGK